MVENDNLNALGKKIFFLHPSAIVQNHVIEELAQEEFEVYVFKEEKKLKQAIQHYPGSIFFASINEFMKENAWDDLVRDIMGKSEDLGTSVGILTSMNDDSLKQKYIGHHKVQCGFTVIKSDFTLATKQLVNILNGVNAKGRRKYIRLITENETNTVVNLPMNGTFVHGIIKDISVVGFSCTFTDDPHLTKNALIGDIQLRLQTQLINAEGIVFGSRVEGPDKIYVILFSQRIDPSVRTKIRRYIHSNLQNRMDHDLR